MFWFRYDAIDYFFFTDELKFFLGGEIEKDNGVCVCWGHGVGAWDGGMGLGGMGLGGMGVWIMGVGGMGVGGYGSWSYGGWGYRGGVVRLF